MQVNVQDSGTRKRCGCAGPHPLPSRPPEWTWGSRGFYCSPKFGWAYSPGTGELRDGGWLTVGVSPAFLGLVLMASRLQSEIWLCELTRDE